MVKLLLISLLFSSSVSSSVSTCGVPKVVNELIVNGKTTVRGEWPWHVAIYKKIGRNDIYACGGTLVTKLHVITVEHCVQDVTLHEDTQLFRDIFVRVGVHRLNLTYREEHRRMIKKIHRFSKNHLRNDIAILELEVKVKFGVYVQAACVSLTKDLTGKLGTVIGWGVDETDQLSNVLKSAQMPVVDIYTCLASDREIFGQVLDEGIFCAGYTNGTAVCNGDSGGGIFFQDNDAWHLGGIVSFAKLRDKMSGLCYVRGYGAFTKIYRYICWIKQVTKLPIAGDQCEDEGFDTDENYTKLFPQDCGINSARLGIQNHPWMAILRYETSSILNGYCEGTLIHKRYVLTHAVCTCRFKPYQVQFGKQHSIGQSKICNEMGCVSPVRDYGIESIIHHPVFTKILSPENTSPSDFEIALTLKANPSNAIALIRLNEDVEFEEYIRPVCLPVSSPHRNLTIPEYLATGWQFGSNLSPSSTLQQATVVADPAGCQQILPHSPNTSSTDLLCMDGPSRAKVCRYNVGGPLGYNVEYHQRGERFTQFGVLFTSSLLLSCDFTHGINVGKHMDWIAANIRP